METSCNFSFNHYKNTLIFAKERGYIFSNFRTFEEEKNEAYVILLRHDIDHSQLKALEFAKIERDLGIKSTYFVRVHSNYYNPYGFKVYTVLKKILDLGHEIGLHYENIDFAEVTNEDPCEIIKKDKKILDIVLEKSIEGIAAHRDFNQVSNLDFWKKHDLKDFGFKYEAYEERFLRDILYISDSLGMWKTGKCMCHYIQKRIPRLYIVTHPCYWYHVSYHLEDSLRFPDSESFR